MPGILKIHGMQEANVTQTKLDALKHKCDSCGLWLDFSDFYKNKSKSSGLQNKCKDCVKDYKIKLKQGLIERQPLIKREFYYIPDIYIVGYGRTQTYQNCCLICEDPFFCLQEIRGYQDLFCEACIVDETKLQERNVSKVNYVGNLIGWISKIENPNKKRIHKNYKKVYQRDNYTCQYCGYNLKNAQVFMPLHIDHIKPWSAQGGNSEKNMVVSCQECNLIASDKWFTTFEEKKEFILFEKLRKTFRKSHNTDAKLQLISLNGGL